MPLCGSTQYVERAGNFGMTGELPEVEATKHVGVFFRYSEVLNVLCIVYFLFLNFFIVTNKCTIMSLKYISQQSFV